MKILVTGATGFIGNHLINKLLENGKYEIIATSRNIEKAKKIKWFSKVKYIQYDFENNSDVNLYNFFDQPDKMIHLAWDTLPSYNGLIHIENFLFNNYRFIKNIVKNGLKDVIITGTCFEYGIVNGCLNENLETKPSNSYGIAKDSLRKFIIELKKNIDFDYKWIRLFYMYGEGQSEKSLIYLLDKAIKNGDKEFNMSGGEQLRDFLHIEDVVKNIILISDQNNYVNEAINCCNGKPISVRKLVEDYLSEKNYKIKLNLGFYPYLSYEAMAFWGNDLKLNNIKKGQNNA